MLKSKYQMVDALRAVIHWVPGSWFRHLINGSIILLSFGFWLLAFP